MFVDLFWHAMSLCCRFGGERYKARAWAIHFPPLSGPLRALEATPKAATAGTAATVRERSTLGARWSWAGTSERCSELLHANVHANASA